MPLKLCIKTEDGAVGKVQNALKEIYGRGFVDIDPESSPIIFWATLADASETSDVEHIEKYLKHKIPEIVDVIKANTKL